MACHDARVKSLRNYLFGVSAFVAAILLGPVIAQTETPVEQPVAVAPATSAAPPPPRAMTPEDVQGTVLKWIGVATVVTTALAGLVAHVLAKVSEVKGRMDRLDTRQQTMQAQVVDLAKNQPPPTTQPPPAAVVAFFAGLGLTLGMCGCAGGQLPKLPPGSYAETRVGFSKDDGPSAKGVIHIPLGRAHRMPPGFATPAPMFAKLNRHTNTAGL